MLYQILRLMSLIREKTNMIVLCIARLVHFLFLINIAAAAEICLSAPVHILHPKVWSACAMSKNPSGV